ncbi:MAG: helix-turn-helix domain-containing protein [Muribaculaceae bacterium]|nr:helix-turn-helix domain-containing protein [Muribaculaceae bacterium]
MEENIYMLPDGEIRRRLGQKVRQLRLRQNFTQVSLAEQAQVSLTTLKKIEKGDISYFDSLMRVLRVLGELDVFSPLIKEEEMSPNEYFEFLEARKKKLRKRASGNHMTNPQPDTEEESEW